MSIFVIGSYVAVLFILPLLHIVIKDVYTDLKLRKHILALFIIWIFSPAVVLGLLFVTLLSLISKILGK